MTSKIQAVKGMNDVLPNQSYQWLYLEAQLQGLMRDFGFSQIRTPIVEQTPLFVRSVGESTDVVEKELYAFEDALNQDQLCLRPEGTAGTLRAVVEHNLLYNNAQRLWYLGPMFRHERPQKGRYRQFHQFGVEALGYADADADAEIMALTYELWKRLGLQEHVSLEINTLGNASERAVHREALIKYLELHVDILDEDGKRRMYKNPLRVLDTKNPSLQEMANQAPKLIDYLGEDSLARYEKFKRYLNVLGIPFVENTRLVRGLDYYNHTVFEWVTSALGAQGTVLAGGRYDGLTAAIGGKDAPGIGFGMGMERVLLLLESLNLLPTPPGPDVYLVWQGEGVDEYALKMAQTLRQHHISVTMSLGGASFKSQMKKADASAARFAVIVGSEECLSQNAIVKSLRVQAEQKVLSYADLVPTLLTLCNEAE